MLLLAVPALAAAQERPALEAGTYVGLSIAKATGDSESMTTFGIPTGTLYLALFPTDQFFIEPEIGLTRMSSGGSSSTMLNLNLWLDVAPASVGANSVYLGAAPALHRWSYGGSGTSGGSESQWGIAGRVGYRILASEGFAVRIEAGYEHWLEKDDNPSGNVFTVRVGLGGVLHRAM